MRVATTVALLTSLLTAGVATAQTTPTLFTHATPSNPLGNLFATQGGKAVPKGQSPLTQQQLEALARQQLEQKASRTVVCGMTIVTADPKIDPGIKHVVPDNGVTFTLKTVQPTVCQK